MRIAVISTPVFSVPCAGYAGLEMIAWACAKGLAAKGHQVFLVAPHNSDCPGVQMIHTGPAGGHDEHQAYNTYWQHLLHMDAVIDHSWMKWSLQLKQEGRLKAPVLSVCHAPVNTMFTTPPPVEKPCIVCISQDQGSHYEALFNRPARVCYNGIDLDYYRPISMPRSDRFLFLARFSSIKGADLAIQVCKDAGVGLDLVGDTTITNEPEYLAALKREVDGELIRFVGPATRGNCVWWFSQAYALLHPVMRFREPFGLAPVEAMACGCPCIAWNNGAMRETLPAENLVTSLEEMEDTVLRWTREGISEETRLASRDRAARFSEKAMCDRYEELCVEAVRNGGW